MGDNDTLEGAAGWLSVILEDGEVMLISGDDLVCSFYLFELPKEWLPYMVFEKQVPG